MTPCKRVAKEDLINWIVTRVHRFNLTANSVKRILNVIVDPFVIKIICVFPLEVKKFRPLSKDKGRTPAKTNSFYTLTTSLAQFLHILTVTMKILTSKMNFIGHESKGHDFPILH